MSELFLHLINISITAGWIILAVILLRLLLKKAPKWTVCLLWALVGLRLLLPFSIESKISLVPSTQTIPQSSILSTAPVIDSGIPAVDEAVNPVISQSLAPNPGDSINPLQVYLAIGTAIWLIGATAMLFYSFLSWLRLYLRVRPRLRMRENIYLCDTIDTPFILGVIRPCIYIPSGLTEAHLEPIIAHEKAHLKRLDHLWKPLGFMLLAVYWFNPLVWVAYILLCRDIEKACDEKVVRSMGQDGRAGYSEALLCCGTRHRMVLSCPLAFGEVGVKERVKAVLSYKKPTFWILIAALLLSLLAGILFLTDPIGNAAQLEAVRSAVSARAALFNALGKDVGEDLRSNVILDCYIDEDYKLCIVLHESARDAEPILKDFLKEYTRAIQFEYTSLTEGELQTRSKDIHSALEAQGYTGCSTVSFFRQRRIIITFEDKDELLSAVKWVEQQKDYPFDDPVVELHYNLNDGKDRYWLRGGTISYIETDYGNELFHKSEAAGEYMFSWLQERGGFSAYKKYIQGCCIGSDSLLHIFLKLDGDSTAQQQLKEEMSQYSDIVRFHMTGHPEEDILQYSEDLAKALTDLGIKAHGGSIHGGIAEGSRQAEVSIIRDDIPIAESLMGPDKPYPFGHTEYFVAFNPLSYTSYYLPMPPEDTVTPEEVSKTPREIFYDSIEGMSFDEIYADPLICLKKSLYSGNGLVGVITLEIVSIELDPEATREHIDHVLEAKITKNTREYLEDNVLVYQVVFDLDTAEKFPSKPLPDGRYQRTIPMYRNENTPGQGIPPVSWHEKLMGSPKYLEPLPEKPQKEADVQPELAPRTSPIVLHYENWIYKAQASPEDTARSVVENLKSVVSIESVQADSTHTELNILFPVDQYRLDAYGYTYEFLKEHLQVVTVITQNEDARFVQYHLKMIKDPETGNWELWYILGHYITAKTVGD